MKNFDPRVGLLTSRKSPFVAKDRFNRQFLVIRCSFVRSKKTLVVLLEFSQEAEVDPREKSLVQIQ